MDGLHFPSIFAMHKYQDLIKLSPLEIQTKLWVYRHSASKIECPVYSRTAFSTPTGLWHSIGNSNTIYRTVKNALAFLLHFNTYPDNEVSNLGVPISHLWKLRLGETKTCGMEAERWWGMDQEEKKEEKLWPRCKINLFFKKIQVCYGLEQFAIWQCSFSWLPVFSQSLSKNRASNMYGMIS